MHSSISEDSEHKHHDIPHETSAQKKLDTLKTECEFYLSFPEPDIRSAFTKANLLYIHNPELGITFINRITAFCVKKLTETPGNLFFLEVYIEAMTTLRLYEELLTQLDNLIQSCTELSVPLSITAHRICLRAEIKYLYANFLHNNQKESLQRYQEALADYEMAEGLDDTLENQNIFKKEELKLIINHPTKPIINGTEKKQESNSAPTKETNDNSNLSSQNSSESKPAAPQPDEKSAASSHKKKKNDARQKIGLLLEFDPTNVNLLKALDLIETDLPLVQSIITAVSSEIAQKPQHNDPTPSSEEEEEKRSPDLLLACQEMQVLIDAGQFDYVAIQANYLLENGFLDLRVLNLFAVAVYNLGNQYFKEFGDTSVWAELVSTLQNKMGLYEEERDEEVVENDSEFKSMENFLSRLKGILAIAQQSSSEEKSYPSDLERIVLKYNTIIKEACAGLDNLYISRLSTLANLQALTQWAHAFYELGTFFHSKYQHKYVLTATKQMIEFLTKSDIKMDEALRNELLSITQKIDLLTEVSQKKTRIAIADSSQSHTSTNAEKRKPSLNGSSSSYPSSIITEVNGTIVQNNAMAASAAESREMVDNCKRHKH